LSISRAWEEARAVLARDGKLLGTVALAMFVLPGIVLDVSMPDAPAGQLPPAGPWVGVALVAILISLVGQLAIIRLAIGSHLTVGEALQHGARRLLPYLAAALIWAVPFVVIASLLYAAAGGGAGQQTAAAGIGLLAVMVIGAYLAVRLILLSSVASAEHSGPIAILQRAWQLSGGNWWRLFGFAILFAVGAIALLWAVSAVVGLFAQLAFGAIGRQTAGGLIVIIVSQTVSALTFLVFFVMLARLYVQGAKPGSIHPSVPSSGT
jgi:hypothetical protein